MKTITPTVLLAVLACAVPSFAQAPAQPGMPRQPRQMVVPPPGMQAGMAVAEASEFPSNVKLSFEGSLFGAIPTDFSILAGGPSFSASFPVKTDDRYPTQASLGGSIFPGTTWTVQLNLTGQVPRETGNGNVDYRDFSFQTIVRLTPGKKVVLWEKGDQKLTLILEEQKE